MIEAIRARVKARPEYEREVRRRLKRGLIVAGILFVLIFLTDGLSLSLLIFPLAILALYVPAWNYVRHGRWVLVLGVLLLEIEIAPDQLLLPFEN